MIEVFAIRHGQTDWNREGRIQGHLDVPLNDTGREQARLLIPHFKRLGVCALITSDLVRARECAEMVSQALDLPCYSDRGLREIFLGKLQGMSKDEIVAQFGERFSGNLRHSPLSDADIAELGSETQEQVLIRTARAVAKARTELSLASGSRVGLVTHGGVLRRWIQSALPEQGFPAPIPNCKIYPLRFRDSGWEFARHNPL